MAPSVGEPAQAWSLFKPTSWGKGGKKIKVAHLPEESNMYYNAELKRWVEKGKESEAAADPGNAPPPTTATVFGTSLTNAIAASGPSGTRKAVASRYVLQNNLSVSSSASDLTEGNRATSSPNLLPAASSGIAPSPRGSQAGGPAPPPKAFFLPTAPAASPDTAAPATEDAASPSPAPPAADKPPTAGDKGFNFYLPGSGDLDQAAKTKGYAWAGYSQTPKPAQAKRGSNLGNPATPTPNGMHADNAGPDSQQPWSQDTSGGATPPPTPIDHVHGAATPDPMLANGMHAALAEEAVAAAWSSGYEQALEQQDSAWQAPYADLHTAAAGEGLPMPGQNPAARQHQAPQHHQPPPGAVGAAAEFGPGPEHTGPPPWHEQQQQQQQQQPGLRYAGSSGTPPVSLENQFSLGGWAATQSPRSLYPGADSSTSLPNLPSGGAAPPEAAVTKASPPLHGNGHPVTPTQDTTHQVPNGFMHGHAEAAVADAPADGARQHDTAKGLHSQGRKLLGALAGYVAQQVSSLDAGGSGGGGGGADEWGFEAAMHPGSVDKLDGPLPWELPEELRYSDEFLSICTAWQRNNPGKLYSPELLVPVSPAQPDSQLSAAPAVDAGDSPGSAWRKGHALRKQQDEQGQGQEQAPEQGQRQLVTARSGAAPPTADGVGAGPVGLPSPPAQPQQGIAESWPEPNGHQGFGFDSELMDAEPSVGQPNQPWDSNVGMSVGGDVEGLGYGVQAEGLGLGLGAGLSVEEVFGTGAVGHGGGDVGAGIWPEQQEQQQQQSEEENRLGGYSSDAAPLQQQPHPPADAPAAPDSMAVYEYVQYNAQGAAEDASASFFTEGARTANAGPAQEEDGSSFFATVGAGDLGVPAHHLAPSSGGEAESAGEELSHTQPAGHGQGHDLAQGVHEVDRVVSDLVSSLEPRVDDAEAAATAASDGWGAADDWLQEEEAPAAAPAAPRAEDPRAQAATLLSQLLHTLQAQPGAGAGAVDAAELERTLALVSTALGGPGTPAAQATPVKAGGDSSSLLTPQRAPGATGFLTSPSPSPGSAGAAEAGASPPPAATVAQPQHHTPEYHVSRKAEREARAAADDTEEEAAMRLEMQGAYDVKLAARTVLEAELVAELAACSVQLEMKFAAKLAERAAELEAKFESEVSGRAELLEVKFEEKVLALRDSLRAEYEEQLALALTERGPGAEADDGEEAAMRMEMQGAYDVKLANRTSVLEAELVSQLAACSVQLERKFAAKLAERAAELEAKFETEVERRAQLLEVKFGEQVMALRDTLRAEYEEQLAAVLAERETRAGADDTEEEAAMRLEMQGAYDVKLAARTSVLEAELVAELAACSLQLEVKFAAKLAERAAELEAKFESEVSGRAELLEAKFEEKVLALRDSLQAGYEGQLADKEAALAERETAERAAALSVAAALAAKLEAQLADHAQELEARFGAAAAERASKLEGKFGCEVAALRAEYEGRLAQREAELAEKAAALEEALQRCSDMQDDQDQLLLCLGQESRKVADLSEAMQAAGLDVDAIIAPIEEEYAMMDELPQDA